MMTILILMLIMIVIILIIVNDDKSDVNNSNNNKKIIMTIMVMIKRPLNNSFVPRVISLGRVKMGYKGWACVGVRRGAESSRFPPSYRLFLIGPKIIFDACFTPFSLHSPPSPFILSRFWFLSIFLSPFLFLFFLF